MTYPILFLILFAVSVLLSAVGFIRYIYFFSVGYGLAVAGIGGAILILCRHTLTPFSVILCTLLIVYGLRLALYLIVREVKSKTYRAFMHGETKSGVGIGVKCAIWLSCALLYVGETAPALSRAASGKTDVCTIIGTIFAALGILLETAADMQKSAAKKKDPHRFCDKGLYRIVRCPNYLGELILWTGVLLGGVTVMKTPLEWVLAILGYLGILYVMFSGARRLELRQNRVYGKDEAYREYVKKTPIILPLVPLYSVEKWKWFVA